MWLVLELVYLLIFVFVLFFRWRTWELGKIRIRKFKEKIFKNVKDLIMMEETEQRF